jgi:hypothetical protein
VIFYNKREKVKIKSRGGLGLEVGRGPLLVLLCELLLDPRDGDGGPYTCPQEREDPSDLHMISMDLKYIYVQRRRHRAE